MMLAWNTPCKRSPRTEFIRTRTNFLYQENAMTRKLLLLAILSITSIFILPSDSLAQREWRSRDRDRSYSGSTYSTNRLQYRNWRARRWRERNRNRYSNYGYRNYGQYRRTQVGNRRFRTVRNYYWNGGRRTVRLTRVYY